jgi:hypothetical protein
MTYQDKINEANKAVRGVLRRDIFTTTASGRVIKVAAGTSVQITDCYTHYKKTPRQCFTFGFVARGWDVKWKVREKKLRLSVDENDFCMLVYKG